MSEHLSRWVITNILCAANLKVRSRYLAKIQSIIVKLIEINNFESAIALFSGLSHPSVYRLRSTFKEAKEIFKETAKKRHPGVKKWQEFENRLLEMERDWKCYSTAISKATAPAIPCLTWTIGKLAQIDAAEPSFVANREGRTGTF